MANDETSSQHGIPFANLYQGNLKIATTFSVGCIRVGQSTFRGFFVRERTKENLLGLLTSELTSSNTTTRSIVIVAVFCCSAKSEQIHFKFSITYCISLFWATRSHKLCYLLDKYTLGQAVCNAIIPAIMVLLFSRRKPKESSGVRHVVIHGLRKLIIHEITVCDTVSPSVSQPLERYCERSH